MAHKQRINEVKQALGDLDESRDPLSSVDAARRLREAAEAFEMDAVVTAREHGVSWAKIGSKYGLTKQGAQQRFAKSAQRAKEKAKASDAEAKDADAKDKTKSNGNDNGDAGVAKDEAQAQTED